MAPLSFDLTPAPNVLIALTHTPMQPLDALCELIDNAIDSFSLGRFEGLESKMQIVSVHLPKAGEVEKGAGVISVQDNGPGMTHAMAERAIKAGFSGNNPYDSLGLFGMGFNIATGKLGRTTRLLTVRNGSEFATQVRFNLQELVQQGSYVVPGEIVDKPDEFAHGTYVEVSTWWPEGHANAGFVTKLLRHGIKSIRDELGRRYASILRKKAVRLLVNGEDCTPFEHCVWSSSRYVVRSGGQIPAVFSFKEVVGTQKRCVDCFALVQPTQGDCPACGSISFRTIEERVSGWLGIQRYDHDIDFGIDLVRNGRTIRIQEKAAFFEFADELKRTIRDYPIDQPYGRIIGEVELNHVPVDFMKQDFQRSSVEWQRAIQFLRGGTSLQPTRAPEGSNTSPLFKLYQGYRKVRTAGKADLYMGYWNADEGRPKRIGREKEKELLARFERREPGFFDDSEWFKLVEMADRPPPADLVCCPQCDAQNFASDDACAVCGLTLNGKECVNSECSAEIPISAVSCPECGTSQAPEVLIPWICSVCRTANPSHADRCTACEAPLGTENALNRETLLRHSSRNDELSLKSATFSLPDGSRSAPPIDVDCYVARTPLRAYGDSTSLPLVIFKGDRIEVFVDLAHPIFKIAHVRVESVVAAEVALFVCDSNRRIASGRYSAQFSLTSLSWEVLSSCWMDRISSNVDQLRTDLTVFVKNLRSRLPHILARRSADIFASLDDNEQKAVVTAIINNRMDITAFSKMVEDGSALEYLSERALLKVFSNFPEEFFDGRCWTDGVGDDLTPPLVKSEVLVRLRDHYRNLLEDVVSFLLTEQPSEIQIARVRLSFQMLCERAT